MFGRRREKTIDGIASDVKEIKREQRQLKREVTGRLDKVEERVANLEAELQVYERGTA